MKELKRVFIKGGILSPSELKQIVNYADSLGLKELHFGSRQDIIFPVYNKVENLDIDDQVLNIELVTDVNRQNIVSSYVAADIFESTTWLGSATYLYIVENFKYQSKLKINITDPKQQLVPLFSGELNFIASENEDYWYLHLRLPNFKQTVYYPVLIYSWDIAKVSEVIEEVYADADDVDELFMLVNSHLETNSRTIEKELITTFKPFPYYEGMNKMGINQYWLGLYWRNNNYYIDFLRDFCDFCLDNRIGKISITPWKSFIVKGIPADSKLSLERFLGKSGINIRHSLLEMNWHLPVNDDEALQLKKFIVRNFDQNDISTYGLTFAVTNREESNIYFTSIVVEKNSVPNIVKDFEVRPTYNVLYSEKFDPNNQKYLVYAQDVDKIELSGLLMELSKMYFNQLGDENEVKNSDDKVKLVSKNDEVFQCSDCLTVLGDYWHEKQTVEDSKISLKNILDNYRCDVCDASKERVVKVIL